MAHLNEYQERDLKIKIELKSMLNSLATDYIFKLQELENDPKHYQVILTNYPIVINGLNYQKRYSIFYRSNNKYVTYEDEKRIREDIGVPQNIGKMNAKKLTTWIKFVIKVEKELVILSKKRIEKAELFIANFREIGGVVRDNNSNLLCGSVVKNGIELSFTIEKNGYISQKLELYFQVNANIENLLKLSSNNYKG